MLFARITKGGKAYLLVKNIKLCLKSYNTIAKGVFIGQVDGKNRTRNVKKRTGVVSQQCVCLYI